MSRQKRNMGHTAHAIAERLSAAPTAKEPEGSPTAKHNTHTTHKNNTHVTPSPAMTGLRMGSRERGHM